MFKALIILAIYMFVLFFGYVEKRLDKKVKFNFKIYDVSDWTKNNCNTYISRSTKLPRCTKSSLSNSKHCSSNMIARFTLPRRTSVITRPPNFG